MTKPVTDTIPDPAYKTPVNPMAIVIGTIFGTLFVAFALVDVSVLSFASDAFSAQYFVWKSQAPYVKHIITFLTLIVPMAVIEITVNITQLATKRATVVRHICDFIHFIAFVLVIYTGIVYISPLETDIIESVLNEEFEDAFQVIHEIYQPTLANLGLNIIMLILPIVKLADQFNNPVPMIPRPQEEQSTETKPDQLKQKAD